MRQECLPFKLSRRPQNEAHQEAEDGHGDQDTAQAEVAWAHEIILPAQAQNSAQPASGGRT